MKKRKIVARARRDGTLRQVAAMPYRRAKSGALQIMLVTTRRNRRFILPKGWRDKGENDPEAAAREAAEEGGVIGHCAAQPLGRFRYWKRLKRDFFRITVQVYSLRVERQLDDWREMDDRQRAWVSPREATRLVEEPELVSLLSSAVSSGGTGQEERG